MVKELLLIGPVGVGRTTTLHELEMLLDARGTPNAIVDLDWLARATPAAASGRTVHDLMVTNLAVVWQPAIEASGLPSWVRMHDLRHAHASWTLAGGADLKTVMERLGHSQISTTQQYLHTLPRPTPPRWRPPCASATPAALPSRPGRLRRKSRWSSTGRACRRRTRFRSHRRRLVCWIP